MRSPSPLLSDSEVARARAALSDLPTPTCLDDARSITGLPQLMRALPATWHLALRVCRPRFDPRRPTMDSWLASGAGKDLLPNGPTDESFRTRRAAANRWLGVVEDLDVRMIEERHLEMLVRIRVQRTSALGSQGTWETDLRCLRRWVIGAQLALGLKPRVAAKWRAMPKAGVRPADSSMSSLDEAQEILAATSDPLDRVRIGLAVGCRLLPGEMDCLRFEDLNPTRWTLFVRRGCRRGRSGARCSRTVSIPPWLQALMVDAWGESLPTSGWCFPRRDDPTQPDTASGDRLMRAARRIGRETTTYTSLRRLGQAIARAARATRLTVRGVVRGAGMPGTFDRDEVVFDAEQRALAEAWVQLMSPPVAPSRLPARAPKGCAPSEPEIDASRRRVREKFKGVVTVEERRTLPLLCLRPGDPARERDVDERTQLERALAGARVGERHALTRARAAEAEAGGLMEEIARLQRELDRARGEARAVTDLEARLHALRQSQERLESDAGAAIFAAGVGGLLAGTVLERKTSRDGT
ncbi:MAG: hypothetical protein ACOZNI_00715 [Myxococcota bacterium]